MSPALPFAPYQERRGIFHLLEYRKQVTRSLVGRKPLEERKANNLVVHSLDSFMYRF
jgi:hypothetical protein